jgi:hypothetical protein
MKKLTLSWSILAASFNAIAAGQQQCVTLDSGNQRPLAAIHLQPATLSTAQCGNKASIRLSASNTSLERQQGNESLLIDGEAARLELTLQKQVKTVSWLDSLSISLPYYRHSAGFLDSTIDGWHDLTGLPEGNRQQRPENTLHYRYQRNGTSLIDINESQQGLGDITVAAHIGPYNLAIKLPTGDEDKLTGSGGSELGLSYSSALPEAGFSGFAATIGATYIIDNKVLPEQSQAATVAGAILAAYNISNRVNLFISGSWQSAWYNSEISTLGGASGNIGIGAYGETAKGFWSARITEDLPTETAPDFGISFDYSIKL